MAKFANSKYHAQRITIDGITFDSKKEARRWAMLKLLEKAGKINSLQRQVPFKLAPAFYVDCIEHLKTKDKVKQVLVHREMNYIADFTYYDHEGNYIVEDTKGFRTEVYRKKKNLMRRIYGIEIKET